jgi:hypothetical protein
MLLSHSSAPLENMAGKLHWESENPGDVSKQLSKAKIRGKLADSPRDIINVKCSS